MTASETTLSSKGQVVLPKDLRAKLGIKEGDKLRVEVDEKTKTIVMRPQIEPPEEIFVHAGTKLTSSILRESDELDETKIKRLLKAIGAKQISK
ncbi:MAG: AbrB/MazE/SpoVT family DNA-binding domain-containing protein [Nitrososphaerales archaeon]